jgi:acyl dehydratase
MKKATEVKIGDEFKLEKHVSKYMPILYAGAGGDFNPIHIDPDFGKFVGLGGNILQGLGTYAFASQTCVDWAGSPKALKRLKVRFASPVRPGDVVTIRGKVVEINGKRIKAELIATNNKGETVLSNASAEMELD